MYKRDIINFLFLISFTVFGVGNYVSASRSPSLGYLVSVSPFLLISAFYLLDVLYKGKVRGKVNKLYYYVLIYLLSGVGSLVYSLYRGLPDITPFTVFGRSLLVLVPFHAFLVVYFYNRRSEEGLIPKLTFLGLTILLLINVLGYAVGMSNQGHTIEGRVSLPFFGGLYSAAGVLAMMSLMLLWYMRKVWWSDPVRMFGYCVFVAINCVIIYQINSRLTLMIFLGIVMLFFFRAIKSSVVYWTSLFLIPLLLNGSLLVYEILSLPVFTSIMQRVDFYNVTTFSGRSFLWEIAFMWLVDDQRGLLFGNGFQGQYFLGILREIAMLWNPDTPDKMHFHSTSLEVMVNQGLFGIASLMIICYKLFVHYRNRFSKGHPTGVFFAALVYLLFDLQVSSFVYLDGFGFVLLAVIAAGATVVKPADAAAVDDKTDNLVEMNALA